jgi:hypothetical protein
MISISMGSDLTVAEVAVIDPAEGAACSKV